MGCWNGSCAVSGLTIAPGDSIVLIPFVSSNRRNTPCMLPIRGKYNDYGSIEEIEYDSIITKMENRILKESFTFFEVTDPETGENVEITDDNKYDDFNDIIPTDRGGYWFGREYANRCDSTEIPTNLEEFFNAVERQMCMADDNVVKSRGYLGTWYSMGFVMVHSHIYDWMVSNKTMYPHGRYNYDPHIVNEADLAELPDQLKALDGQKLGMDFFRLMMKVQDKLSITSEEGYSHLSAPYLSDCDSRDEARLLCNKTYEFVYFRSMFRYFRKAYSQSAGEGYQDDNTKHIKKLNTAINKFTIELVKERNIRWGE